MRDGSIRRVDARLVMLTGGARPGHTDNKNRAGSVGDGLKDGVRPGDVRIESHTHVLRHHDHLRSLRNQLLGVLGIIFRKETVGRGPLGFRPKRRRCMPMRSAPPGPPARLRNSEPHRSENKHYERRPPIFARSIRAASLGPNVHR